MTSQLTSWPGSQHHNWHKDITTNIMRTSQLTLWPTSKLTSWVISQHHNWHEDITTNITSNITAWQLTWGHQNWNHNPHRYQYHIITMDTRTSQPTSLLTSQHHNQHHDWHHNRHHDLIMTLQLTLGHHNWHHDQQTTDIMIDITIDMTASKLTLQQRSWPTWRHHN